MDVVIVADDLTGAADAGAPFAARGLGTVIAPWNDDRSSSTWDAAAGLATVLVIETDSRNAPADAAAARAEAVGRWVRRRPEQPWVMKKIDSRLRGPIAAEVRGLRRGLGTSQRAIVAPALPSQGRVTVRGHQHLEGHIVGAGSTTADPFGEPTTAAVAQIAGLDRYRVVGPAEAVPANEDVVVNATTEQELRELCAKVHGHDRRLLLIGSAGLTGAFASIWDARGAVRTRTEGPTGDGVGTALVISLSPAQAAREQCDELARQSGTLRVELDIEQLISGSPAASMAVSEALAARPRTVLITLSGSAASDAPTEHVGRQIREHLIPVLAAADLPELVVANGGDAARAVIECWQATTLEVLRELPANAALLHAAGTTRWLATKSGSFGTPGALCEVLVQARKFARFAIETRPKEAS